MKNTEKQQPDDEQALREARRKCATTSIAKRYEELRKLTGMNGAERFQQLNINENVS